MPCAAQRLAVAEQHVLEVRRAGLRGTDVHQDAAGRRPCGGAGSVTLTAAPPSWSRRTARSRQASSSDVAARRPERGRVGSALEPGDQVPGRRAQGSRRPAGPRRSHGPRRGPVPVLGGHGEAAAPAGQAERRRRARAPSRRRRRRSTRTPSTPLTRRATSAAAGDRSRQRGGHASARRRVAGRQAEHARDGRPHRVGRGRHDVHPLGPDPSGPQPGQGRAGPPTAAGRGDRTSAARTRATAPRRRAARGPTRPARGPRRAARRAAPPAVGGRPRRGRPPPAPGVRRTW